MPAGDAIRPRVFRLLGRTSVSSFLITLVVWLVFTWPLALHLNEGIPCSTQNQEKDQMRRMISGDHLQLMYHYQLVEGFLSGEIPWLHNLYEFNLGDDDATFVVRGYFLPWSFVFAVLALLFGPALAWNLSGLLCYWLTYYFTIHLVRFFGHRWLVAYTAGLVAIILPWRWVSWMGGSPMGYAMCWLPAFWLGAALLLRDRSWRGGVLAGLASLFLSTGDYQTYYFSLLSAPIVAGCLLIYLRPPLPWWRLVRAGLPGGGLILLSLVHAVFMKKGHANANLEGGRSLNEVALSSPHWQDFFTWQGTGLVAHAYLGYVMVALLLISLIALVRTSRWTRLTGFILAAGIAVALVLGLGMHGPDEGRALIGARKLLPYYERIRQPMKIWSLMPTLLALFSAYGFTWITGRLSSRLGVGLTILVTAALSIEYAAQIRPTICLLDQDNQAYSAMGELSPEPRALMIPLWPGDSDWSSLYEYYAIRYGVRMVNGYSPVVKTAYAEQVYRPLSSANQGVLSRDQLDRIRGFGVEFVVLHENAFPEVVSPWPVGVTLQRLVKHPALEYVRQDGPVHLFRLRSKPVEAPLSDLIIQPQHFLPARRYRAEGMPVYDGHAAVIQDVDLYGGQALRIHEVGTRWSSRPTLVLDESGLAAECALRVRGRLKDEEDTDPSAWRWIRRPLLHQEDGLSQFKYVHQGGVLDIDTLNISFPGSARPLGRYPASAFFHAGFSHPGEPEVYFQPHEDHAGEILYGLLVSDAPYTGGVRLAVEVDEPILPGKLLGSLELSCGDDHVSVPVRGPNTIAYIQCTYNFPLRVSFIYAGHQACRIQHIDFEPSEPQPVSPQQ